jgi:hypothetical protein
MPSYQANLVSARDAALAKLVALELSNKVNHSIDGESIQWTTEKNDMLKRIKDYDDLIQMMDGGFEVQTQTYT